MKTWVAAKLHGLTVTDAALHYNGSITICKDLMALVGIEPFEQVHVVNLTTGSRWVTYAIEGEPGTFVLNGGGARLGLVGDQCVVMSFRQSERMIPAKVCHVNQQNQPTKEMQYAHS